ncbi:MAG TPA: family 20 glycosylhydrolase [Devosia sp.]|nr:family 20 glycosylhydrolase [Devosia sp.]
MTTAIPFRLETRWMPARDGQPLAYELKLTNLTDRAFSGFRLAFSGPARIDPTASIEGGTLSARISNHSELTPPADFILEAGASWTAIARGLSYGLRHWSDGANSAYVVLDDGSTLPVAVNPTIAIGQNAPLRKGTQRYPVPEAPISLPGGAPVPVSVIPWPNSVSVEGRRSVPAGLAPAAESAASRAAAEAFAELVGSLFPAEGIVRPAAEGGLAIHFADDAALAPEAYRIDFAGEPVVHAASSTGYLYGLITLGQIWRGAHHHPGTFVFPAGGQVVDQPQYGWRGSHLDVARQFYSSSEVKQFLRLLAWSKMNRFHWHLSDDEAWRVEIDAYPDLVRIGAWRGHGLPIPALLGSGAEPTGGYYSKPAIRDIVGMAGRFGITVVPEIDVPGHSFALLASIPELRDPQEHGDYSSVQGFPNNCINPALEVTYEVLGRIFDELVELFPARIVHIGADEVPLGAWSGSPKALEKLAELAGPEAAAAHAKRLNTVTNTHGADDIEGSGAAALQAVFLARVQKMLADRGCLTGGWEEAAHGDLIDKAKSYLCGWRSVEVSAALAGRGYDIVVTPGQAYYLDMSQGVEWAEPGAGWAGWSSVEKTYEFEASAGWSAAQKSHLLGVQACIWSEPMTDRAIFDRLVFPRLSAIAEAGWTIPARKSLKRFEALCGLLPNLYGHYSD